MSCHHSGPSAQRTGRQKTNTLLWQGVIRLTPLCPGLPGKKQDPAHSLFTRDKEQLCWGFPSCASSSTAGWLRETSAFCVSTPGQAVTGAARASLLATYALLLHTLSPLCDHGTVRKGLLVCSITKVHRTSSVPKLPKLQ